MDFGAFFREIPQSFFCNRNDAQVLPLAVRQIRVDTDPVFVIQNGGNTSSLIAMLFVKNVLVGLHIELAVQLGDLCIG